MQQCTEPPVALGGRRSFRSVVAVAVLLAASVPAGAQDSDTLSARTLWLACRHPAVAPGASTAPGDSTPLRQMRALCNDVRLTLRNGRPAIEGRALAATLTSLPTVAVVRAFASTEHWPATTERVDTLSTAFFDLNSAALTDDVRTRMRDFARKVRTYLETSPGDTIDLVGSTDTSGSAAVNQSLARRRIEAISTVLANEGVDLSRVRMLTCPRVAAPMGAALRRVAGTTAMAACDAVGASQVMVAGRAPATAAGRRDALDRAVVLVARPRAIATPTTMKGMSAPALSTEIAAAGPALSAASLPVAVVDAVIAEARADLEAGLLDRALERVCGKLKLQALVTQTCTLRTQSQDLLYAQGISAIRAALRADLRDAPWRLARFALAGGLVPADSGASVNRVSSELLLLAYALETYRAAPDDPWEWVARYAAWSDTVAQQANVARSRANQALEAFAGLASMVDAARAEIPPDMGQALAATLPSVEYAVKAYAVLALDSAAQPRWKTRSWIGRASAIPIKELYGGAMAVAAAAEQLRQLASQPGAMPDAKQVAVLGRAVLEAARATYGPGAAASTTEQRLLSIVGGAADLQALAQAGNRRELLFRLFAVADSLITPRLDTTGGPVRGLTLSPSLKRALSFATDLAEAQDQAAVTVAVRSFVHEGQGYRGKRLRSVEDGPRRYWTVNAYLGGSLAAEVPCGNGLRCGGGEGVSRGQLAIFLPLGFELGRRPASSPSDKSGRASSWGVFVQLFDVGALGAARLSGKGADTEDASLRQFFSPGIYLMHSWGASPFVLGGGVSYARDAQQGGKGGVAAIRPSVIVAFDVPLFP